MEINEVAPKKVGENLSLSMLEIKAVPQYQLLSTNVEEAKHSVCSIFIDLLSYISSISCIEATAIELILLKSECKEPRILISLRSSEGSLFISESQAAKAIKTRLEQAHFSVQEVKDDLASTVGEIRSAMTGKMIALTKEEKLASSAVSYSGYYYYTDILDSADRNAELSNFNNVLSILTSCERAMVSFQLIPTQFSQAESFALSSLSAELATTTQGVYANQQMVREPIAEAPKKAYTYYVDRASQPLFLGNIIVASDRNHIDGLVSALKTSIQSCCSQPVGLTSVPVENSCQLAQDFFNYPWNLCNQLLTDYRNLNIWNGTAYQPTNLARLPYLYTASEAATFFRLPIDDGKILGVRSNKAANDNEIISERVTASENIQFGHLLNSDKVIIGTSAPEFTRHALVVGAPGSGKTTFAINLLLQFYRKGIPFLVIEPTKTEYRALIDLIPDLQVFTPGKNGVVPYIINPFVPPAGVRLEQYIPSLMSAFRAAFAMESPLDVIFLRAVRQCYAQYGWKNSSMAGDKDVQPFGLHEFVLVFQKLVAESNYKPETKANIETGGTFRLLNLIDQNRFIYDTVHTIPIEELLNKPTVLELNAVADDEQKSLIMALLLVGVCLYTKERGSSSGEINNLLMIDEAHVLLDAPVRGSDDQNKAQGITVKSLQKMIAEIRSFGTGIIIADQVPSKVTSDIVANTDLKVVFRLVENKEREIIANSTNMSEQQAEHLARLKRGEAIVYYSELDSPKIIMTPDVRKGEGIRHKVPDEEIKTRIQFWDTRGALLIPYYECTTCDQCRNRKKCTVAVREKADYYASHIISAVGTHIRDKETLAKYLYRLHELVINYEAKSDTREPIKLLCNCTKVHFIRSILAENGISMSRNATIELLNKTLIREGNGNV